MNGLNLNDFKNYFKKTNLEINEIFGDYELNKFDLNIKNNKLPEGIAIDDGVAVVLIDGKPTEVYSTVENHNAYFLDKNKKVNLKEYIKNL